MAKLLDITKKYQIILLCMIVVFILIILSFLGYSYFSKKENNENPIAIVENSGNLTTNYLDGKEINIKHPKENLYTYTFSITNTGDIKLYYSIYLKECEILGDNVSLRLQSDGEDTVYNDTYKAGDNLLRLLKSIEPGQTDRYKLSINNNGSKKNIFGILEVVNESINEETFADMILNNNRLSTAKTVPGTDLANTNEGLIKDEDDAGSTYYFRGNVQNNYLKIGEHQFRIVRINGDGTVKVILDEPLENKYAFTVTPSAVAQENALFSKSSIASSLNTWVENEFKEYITYFSSNNFCSDNSFVNIVGELKRSNTYQRIIVNEKPTFKCLGTQASNRVGLLTADEIAFAGAVKNNENKNYYLYNPEITYNTWTISSYELTGTNAVNMFTLSANGGFGKQENTITPLNVRPVLNINLGAHVRGEGTKDNPYILVY